MKRVVKKNSFYLEIFFIDDEEQIDEDDSMEVVFDRSMDRKEFLESVYTKAGEKGKIPVNYIPTLCSYDTNLGVFGIITTSISNELFADYIMNCDGLLFRCVLKNRSIIPIRINNESITYNLPVRSYDDGVWDVVDILASRDIHVVRGEYDFYFMNERQYDSLMTLDMILEPVPNIHEGQKYIELIRKGSKEKKHEIILIGDIKDKEDGLEIRYTDKEEITSIHIDPNLLDDIEILGPYINAFGTRGGPFEDYNEHFQCHAFLVVLDLLKYLVNLSKEVPDNPTLFIHHALKQFHQLTSEGNLIFLTQLIGVSDYAGVHLVTNILIRFYADILTKTYLPLPLDSFISVYDIGKELILDLHAAEMIGNKFFRLKGFSCFHQHLIALIAIHSTESLVNLPALLISQIIRAILDRYNHGNLVSSNSILAINVISRKSKELVMITRDIVDFPDFLKNPKPFANNNLEWDLHQRMEFRTYSNCTLYGSLPSSFQDLLFWNPGSPTILIVRTVGEGKRTYEKMDLTAGVKEVHNLKPNLFTELFIVVLNNGEVNRFRIAPSGLVKDIIFQDNYVITLALRTNSNILFIIDSNDDSIYRYNSLIPSGDKYRRVPSDYKGKPISITSHSDENLLLTTFGLYMIAPREGKSTVGKNESIFEYLFIDLPPVISMVSCNGYHLVLTTNGLWINDQSIYTYKMTSPSNVPEAKGKILLNSPSKEGGWRLFNLDSSIILDVWGTYSTIFYLTHEGLFVISDGEWPDLVYTSEELGLLDDNDYTSLFGGSFSRMIRERGQNKRSPKKKKETPMKACYQCNNSVNELVNYGISVFRKLPFCRNGSCREVFHKRLLNKF